jgi:NADPH2:quinone reductase
VGGIDVSGVVVSSADPRLSPGDRVLVTGCGLGEVHDGGYAEYLRVPADWVIPLPPRLGLFEAMAIGTAGFTAALALQRLEDNHQSPHMGPVLVTGATGGVGSYAIALLHQQGYRVTALSGKLEHAGYLRDLGAEQVLDRHGLSMGQRPLEKALWGGAIDNVGGEVLGWITRTVSPWGNIVAVGLAGGTRLQTTVMPFILRGVSLLGVSSANCPLSWRRRLWERLAGELYPRKLEAIVTETITLDGLPGVFARMMDGRLVGRVVVKIKKN